MANHTLDFKTKSTILHFCLVKFRVNQNDTNGIFNMCWLYFITWVLLDDSFSKRRSQKSVLQADEYVSITVFMILLVAFEPNLVWK